LAASVHAFTFIISESYHDKERQHDEECKHTDDDAQRNRGQTRVTREEQIHREYHEQRCYDDGFRVAEGHRGQTHAPQDDIPRFFVWWGNVLVLWLWETLFLVVTWRGKAAKGWYANGRAYGASETGASETGASETGASETGASKRRIGVRWIDEGFHVLGGGGVYLHKIINYVIVDGLAVVPQSAFPIMEIHPIYTRCE